MQIPASPPVYSTPPPPPPPPYPSIILQALQQMLELEFRLAGDM